MTNEELVILAKQGDEAAKNQLFINNDRFAYHIAKKFRNNTEIDQQDLVCITKLGMVKAYNAYDPAKGVKFLTFSSMCMSNEILMELRKSRKHKGIASLEAPIKSNSDGNSITISDLVSDNWDFTQHFENKSMVDKVYELLEKLTPTYKIVAVEFLINGKSQKEVADIMGLSQSYISRIGHRVQLMFQKYRDKGVFSSKGGKSMVLINDIISVPDSHGNQIKVYVVDLSPDLNEAYGIKLTNGGKADLRTKLNKDGWNYLVPWSQLSAAKVIKQHVKLEEINTPTDTKEDMKTMNDPSTVTTRQATPDEARKYGIKRRCLSGLPMQTCQVCPQLD